MMRRVVLDTSVITSALRSRMGASFLLLQAVQRRRLTMIATPSLFLEYEDVLKRAEQRAASGLTLDDVDELLAELAALVEPAEVYWLWRPQLRDPDDDMVLEAAVNGHADALVTYNTRDFSSVIHRFGVRLAKPADILKDL